MTDPSLAKHVWAPIFPLPNVVLPPGTLLPLHVFEPRYRAMLLWTEARERLIAIALYDLQREPEPDGTPHVHGMLGLGRIVDHEPLPDGRSNIVLLGIARCRILEEERHREFRVARLETMRASARDPVEAKALASMLTARLGIQKPRPAEDEDICSDIADRALQILPMDILTRQTIFATLDLSQRLRALHRLLDGVLTPPPPDIN